MGTPDFAVPTLEHLIKSKHTVTAVFTQEPKPKGRGLEVSKSPVHIIADKNYIEVFTPKTLRNEETFENINSIKADIIVVCAYGFIIPKNILESKKYGCINLHPSKLPRFRGAAPLQHTIMEGDRESSICVIQMNEGLDTGDILIQKDFEIPVRASLKWLHDYTAEEGAKLVLSALDNYDRIRAVPQTEEGVLYASKLTKIDSFISFNIDAFKLDCKIRGMAAWPFSFFNTSLGEIKIIEAEPIYMEHNLSPGSVIDRENLIIACKTNAIKLNKIQLKNKNPINSKEFYNGYKNQEFFICENSITTN